MITRFIAGAVLRHVAGEVLPDYVTEGMDAIECASLTSMSGVACVGATVTYGVATNPTVGQLFHEVANAATTHAPAIIPHVREAAHMVSPVAGTIAVAAGALTAFLGVRTLQHASRCIAGLDRAHKEGFNPK